MIVEYSTRLTPAIRKYDPVSGQTSEFSEQVKDLLKVYEISPMTTALIATHPGESGTVYADTRVRQPARYRAQIGVPINLLEAVSLDDETANLFNASSEVFQLYTVTSFSTAAYGMAVVSSSARETVEQIGLKLYDVVFQECLEVNSPRKRAMDNTVLEEDGMSLDDQAMANTNPWEA